MKLACWLSGEVHLLGIKSRERARVRVEPGKKRKEIGEELGQEAGGMRGRLVYNE